MKTLICSAGWAPAANSLPCPLSWSGCTLVPGANVARSRKFRLLVGKSLICCWLTLVATSVDRVAAGAAATTLTVASVTALSASWKLSARSSPTRTCTFLVLGAEPMRVAPFERFLASRRAPESGAPALFVTYPRILPVVVCAAAAPWTRTIARAIALVPKRDRRAARWNLMEHTSLDERGSRSGENAVWERARASRGRTPAGTANDEMRGHELPLPGPVVRPA